MRVVSPSSTGFKLGLQEAHPELLGSFHVGLAVVDAVGGCEHVLLGHQGACSASGQLHGGREGVVEQEVLPKDAEPAVVAVDLPLPPRLPGRLPLAASEDVDAHLRLSAAAVGIEGLVGQVLLGFFVSGQWRSLMTLGSTRGGHFQLGFGPKVRLGQAEGGLGQDHREAVGWPSGLPVGAGGTHLPDSPEEEEEDGAPWSPRHADHHPEGTKTSG